MSESWVSGVGWASWALAIAIYIFGIASGWLIWGGRRSSPGERAGADADAGPAGADASSRDGAGGEMKKAAPGAAPAKLAALESEIRKARALLEKGEEEAAVFSEDLTTLDQTIKRANGRLKLILRAVQRAVLEP